MQPGYTEVLIWSFFLFLGYFGFGEFFVRSLKRPEFMDLGWASKVALGMCITIFLGSALMVFKLATAVGLVSIAVLGFCLAAYFMGQQFFKPLPDSKSKRGSKRGVDKKGDLGWLYLSIPAAFALLTFATSIYWPFQYDPNDDWVAYLAFPEKILQTGTLIEPFSQRRITSLCGQSLLLAQIMVVAEPESAHLLDRGFGAILLFGLLVEATRKTAPGWQWLRALIVLAAVTVSVPRINTSSTVIGVCLMLGVLFSMSKVLDTKESDWRVWALPALMLAGASSLRFTYAMACGGALAVYYFWNAFSSPPKEWFFKILPLLKTGLMTFVFLSPLMVVSWESSRTPIYPPFPGNLVTEFITFNTGEGFFKDSKIAIRFMLMPELLMMLTSFALILFVTNSNRRLLISMVLVVLTVSYLLGISSSASIDTWTLDFYRFTFPLYFTAFLWILSLCVSQKKALGFLSAPSMATVGLILFAIVQIIPALEELKVKFTSIPLQEKGFQFSAAALKPYYDELQNKVPPGQKIFAVVDAPYLLNYNRNPISNVDNIAGASPAPGMPFHKGPEALRAYLNNLGYNYAISVDFEKAVFLYNINIMQNHPRKEFRQFSKKYISDFLENLESICKTSTLCRNLNSRLVWIGSVEPGK